MKKIKLLGFLDKGIINNMKLIFQRVKKAKVSATEKVVGQIETGLLVFIGIGKGDSEEEIIESCNKLLNLRIFENDENKFDKSVLDIKGELLIIPQFTLFADCSKGNRPYFGEAARPEIAQPLFESFVNELKKSGLKVESGVFGAKMEIEVVNDGPVTIIL